MIGYYWTMMGFIRYPIAFAWLAVLALTVWSTIRLLRPGAEADLLTKTWIDATLFWGAFAQLAGILGTLVGFILAASAIEQAGTVSTSLVWGGMKVAMTSAVAGAVVLGFASLAWFALQLRWRVLAAEEADL